VSHDGHFVEGGLAVEDIPVAELTFDDPVGIELQRQRAAVPSRSANRCGCRPFGDREIHLNPEIGKRCAANFPFSAMLHLMMFTIWCVRSSLLEAVPATHTDVVYLGLFRTKDNFVWKSRQKPSVYWGVGL